MFKIKKQVKKIAVLLFALAIAFSFNPNTLQAQENINETISNLNEQVKDKKTEIENLQQQIESYQENIKTKQLEALSLENQLSLINSRTAKKELSIKSTQVEIEKTNLEIQGLELQIKEAENKITINKERLAELIRTVYQEGQKNYLEILAMNDSFSNFFDQLMYLEKVQESLQTILNDVKALKGQLETKKNETQIKNEELKNLEKKLKEEKDRLEEERNYKTVILGAARSSEQQFQNLAAKLKKEQEQVNSDVVYLEKLIRQKLEENDQKYQKLNEGETILSWPINPSRGFTATFHDSDYPYRYIFEHPAVDIRTAQGTSIKAPAPGYVARAKNSGMGYSYIMLIHGDGISTVYGHVSRIYVQEDGYVSRGDIIGLTGGMPGTSGAGRLTTGPHLHFEVRLNGIPVNPLEYLP